MLAMRGCLPEAFSMMALQKGRRVLVAELRCGLRMNDFSALIVNTLLFLPKSQPPSWSFNIQMKRGALTYQSC
jgi:hypothetical protein